MTATLEVTDLRKQFAIGRPAIDGVSFAVPAGEIVVLHDPDAEKAVVILFFESEDDYRRGDETLNAMPAGDTPGQRTAVAKYDVAFRMTGER